VLTVSALPVDPPPADVATADVAPLVPPDAVSVDADAVSVELDDVVSLLPLVESVVSSGPVPPTDATVTASVDTVSADAPPAERAEVLPATVPSIVLPATGGDPSLPQPNNRSSASVEFSRAFICHPGSIRLGTKTSVPQKFHPPF
jgi:hypothetical protein